MKNLLIVTALLEGGGGAALMAVPTLMVPLLIGAAPDHLVLARLVGAALLALGSVCWLARNRAGRGLIVSLLVYNVTSVAVLGYAGLALKWSGIGLWPAVALHVALAMWCLLSLRRRETLNARATFASS